MKHITFLALFLLSVLPISLLAQHNMTLYQMHGIPQSNTLNPAIPASCGWIVGIPGLGSVSAGISSPVSLNDAGAKDGTLYTDLFVSKLRSYNTLSLQSAVNLITVGYRRPRAYYQLTVNERVGGSLGISKAPIELLVKGTDGFDSQTVSGDFYVNAAYYREYAFTFAHELTPSLWVGARPRLIFGRMGVKSNFNTAELYVHSGTLDIDFTTNLAANMSVPGAFSFDPVTGKVTDFRTDIQLSDLIFNPSNIGFGLDLGVVKQFDNGINASASVLNLGLILWSKNSHALNQGGTVSVSGPYQPSMGNDILDMLDSFSDFNHAEESYRQILSPVAMVGANYPVSNNIRVGATGMVEVLARRASPIKTNAWAFSATAFTEGLPWVDLGLSYTISPYSFFNVGIGIGAHLGPVDVHFTTDNIIAAFDYKSASYATVQVGINLRFGCGGDKGGPASKSKKTYRSVPCPTGKPR